MNWIQSTEFIQIYANITQTQNREGKLLNSFFEATKARQWHSKETKLNIPHENKCKNP